MHIPSNIGSTSVVGSAVGEWSDYSHYLWGELWHPHGHNYIYWLLGISVFVFALELLFPWRKNQRHFRQDFWLDFFYMFFNLFIFQVLGYKLISSLSQDYFHEFLSLLGIEGLLSHRLVSLPIFGQLLILFVLRDFIQWWIHRLLHKSDFLWGFHKVHHSVKEMGFAAHLRFHWMETVIYNTLQFIPLGMLGFTLEQYLGVYIVSILIGHLNHANIRLPLGSFKYVLNNPQMHIWHHTKDLPTKYSKGCNFGLSLSLWDYLFKTAYVPSDGRDNKLGFFGVESFPRKLWGQLLVGFGGKKKADQ